MLNQAGNFAVRAYRASCEAKLPRTPCSNRIPHFALKRESCKRHVKQFG